VRGRPTGKIRVELSDVPPIYGSAVPKSLILQYMTPFGQVEALPNLLFLNCCTEETQRQRYAKVNSAEMIRPFGNF